MANWSAERKDDLRKMWKEGFTSAQISEILGGVSRNAVMGMVHRLGLMGDADHAANSISRLSGCCATGWRREAPAAIAAPAMATDAVLDLGIERIDAAEPAPVVVANDDAAFVVAVAANDEGPAASRDEVASPAEIDADPDRTVEADPSPAEEPAPVHAGTVAPETSVAAVLEAEEPVAVEADAPVEEPASEPEPAPQELPQPVEQPAADEETPPWDVDPVEEASAEAVESPETGDAEVAPEPVAPPETVDAVVTRPARLREAVERPSPVARIPRVRPVAKPVAKAVAKAPERRIPSSRSWRPLESVSRMPPRASEVPPPGEVVISDGVMSNLRSVQVGMAASTDAFDLLKRLTGVAYDARVPGHVPALVAIATVLARGDPRSVLTPTVPEQSVLRVMRTFAEKGVVVAGKPPARWLEDVSDRAFYDEMLKLEAA